MTPDPAPDSILIGIFADSAMLPFIVSSGRMVWEMLAGAHFPFELGDAIVARGLLKPAELQSLLASGQALLKAHGPAGEPDEAADDAILYLREDAAPTGAAARPSWPLTLADVIMVATMTDFMATAHLTTFGEEMRAVQVDHNGVPADVYDGHVFETLGYLARFQAEWGGMFGHYASYQARMAELAALRAEFVR